MADSQSKPDHPSTIHLGGDEVEAIKIARRALPEMMRNLVQLGRSRNPSQARQAIEVLFSYGLANRQQQYDFTTGETVEVGGDTHISLSLTKVEMRLTEIMANMPPDLAVQFATLIEQMEQRAEAINMPIIDGDQLLVDVVPDSPLCQCGCGEHVRTQYKQNVYDRKDPTRIVKKKGEWADYAKGHHLRAHVAHPRIPPQEIRRLKEAGQWPPRDDEGNAMVGMDKKKRAKAKKDAIKAKRAARVVAIENAETDNG